MMMSCHACGSDEIVAMVSDWQKDHCYHLCNKCLHGEWPPWEARKKRIMAELDQNLPTPEGVPHDG